MNIVGRVLKEIRKHAEEAYPEECCGLLMSDSRNHVVDSVRMTNAYMGSRHNRYHIDPLEFYRVDRTAAQRGLTIAGIYHSHPDHPASLSQFDLDHSFPWYSYVVVSVSRGKADDARSWSLKENRMSSTEEKIEVSSE